MILVTGGAGRAAEQTVIGLLQAGHDVLVYDNFSSGSVDNLKRVAKATGRDFDCVNGDVRNGELLQKVFADNNISEVMHFAFLNSPSESVTQPLEYYENNVAGTMILLQVMQEFGVKRLSIPAAVSVADTVLGSDNELSPYFTSMQTVERMLADMSRADPAWVIARI